MKGTPARGGPVSEYADVSAHFQVCVHVGFFCACVVVMREPLVRWSCGRVAQACGAWDAARVRVRV